MDRLINVVITEDTNGQEVLYVMTDNGWYTLDARVSKSMGSLKVKHRLKIDTATLIQLIKTMATIQEVQQ